MPADPPSKKEHLLALLERGSVFVHLDPRREGVMVPPWLGRMPQLVLQLGLNFAIPIPDLEVDGDGVRCTLSFNRSPFFCNLPWSAVYALVAEDGQVTVWPTELPAELVPAGSPVRKSPPATRDRRTRARPPISVVPPAADSVPAEATPAPPRVPSIAPAPMPAPALVPTPRAPTLIVPPAPAASASEPTRPVPLSRVDRASEPPAAKPRPRADGRKQPKDRPPYLRLIK